MSAARTRRVLILASASPRRRALLKTFRIPFRVVEPRIDEDHHERWAPARLVTRNATRKAEAVATRRSTGVILSADTVVVLGGRYFGKPRDQQDARRMLRSLSGRTHRVYTGVCVIDLERRRRWVDVAITRVTMRAISAEEIAGYAADRTHRDKAGAYAIQELDRMVVDRVVGSLSNVIGLPLDLVERRLRQCGLLPAPGRPGVARRSTDAPR